MFVGHLAAGLILKARVPETSLPWLLFATVLPDFLCGFFLLLGLEDVVVHETLVYSQLDADIGYSHSLLATAGCAALLAYLGLKRWHSWRVGLALGLAVISHFVLDVLAHRADMPLLGFGSAQDLRLGTGLAAHPLPYFLVELSFCLFAWFTFDARNRRLLIAILVLMTLYANSIFGFVLPPIPSPALLGALMIVFFAVAGSVILATARGPQRALRPREASAPSVQ